MHYLMQKLSCIAAIYCRNCGARTREMAVTVVVILYRGYGILS